MIQYEFSQELLDPEDMPLPVYLEGMGNRAWMLVQINLLVDDEMVGVIMQRPKGFKVEIYNN